MRNKEAAGGIHPTAIVDPKAQIGTGVSIGPYSVISADTVIGDGTQLDAHVIIEPFVSVGKRCRIMSGTVLGGQPQDYRFKGEESYITIGDGNIIREYVTIHRASGAGESTVLGNENMLMAYCHIGHNCRLANNITMANYVGISGHVQVEDRVVFGGFVGVHQKVRIGKMAMIGGFSKVVQDVPPFALADGRPCRVFDVNVVGLRRSGMTPKERADVKHAYKLLFRSQLNTSQALEAIAKELESSPGLDYLVDFITQVRRGFGGRQLETPRY